MGLFDDAKDYAQNLDPGADHMERGFGFDPAVCQGCPKRMDDTRGKPCQLCGCPTTPGMLLDRLDAPPSDCIRLSEHQK